MLEKRKGLTTSGTPPRSGRVDLAKSELTNRHKTTCSELGPRGHKHLKI